MNGRSSSSAGAFNVLLMDKGRVIIQRSFTSEEDAELYIENLSGGYDAFTLVREYPRCIP